MGSVTLTALSVTEGGAASLNPLGLDRPEAGTTSHREGYLMESSLVLRPFLDATLPAGSSDL